MCDAMIDFFGPFCASASKYTLERSMLELCEKAYALSVLLRKSRKCTFETVIWEKDTPVTAAIKEEISVQSSYGPPQDDISMSKIAMTVSGALVKFPEGPSGERVMLEKSQVVCRF